MNTTTDEPIGLRSSVIEEQHFRKHGMVMDGKPPVHRVPDFKPTTYVRQLTVYEFVAFWKWRTDHKDANDWEINAQLWARAVCNKSGALLYTLDDIPVILDNLHIGLWPVIEKILKINGFR